MNDPTSTSEDSRRRGVFDVDPGRASMRCACRGAMPTTSAMSTASG